MRELRKTVICHEEHTVCQRGQGEIAHACRDTDDGPLVSRVPPGSTSEHHSPYEEEDIVTDRLHYPENAEVVGHLEGESNQGDSGGGGGGGDGPFQNEISEGPNVTGIISPSPESNSTSTNKPGYSPWDIESNHDTTAALHLNLVQKWTQKGRIYLTFSMDGKYLATASSLGILSIYDSKTRKRIR